MIAFAGEQRLHRVGVDLRAQHKLRGLPGQAGGVRCRMHVTAPVAAEDDDLAAQLGHHFVFRRVRRKQGGQRYTRHGTGWAGVKQRLADGRAFDHASAQCPLCGLGVGARCAHRQQRGKCQPRQRSIFLLGLQAQIQCGDKAAHHAVALIQIGQSHITFKIQIRQGKQIILVR